MIRTLFLVPILMARLAHGQAQCFVPVPCDLLSNEINDAACDPQHFVWTDGTVLSESQGLSVPTMTFDVNVVLGGLPLSFTVVTEKSVRFTMSTGGQCTGVKRAIGWEDPKSPVTILGRTLQINKPTYLCNDAPHGPVLCFEVKGAVQPPLTPPGFPCSTDRIEQACVPL